MGSIGVISSLLIVKQFAENHGIEYKEYASGAKKGFLNPFKEPSELDEQRLAELQRAIHNNFIDQVKNSR